MTLVIENQEFRSCYDRHSGADFEDIELRNCRFVSCRLSQTEDPAWRSVVRNVKIINCEVDCSFVDAAIVEDVVVDGLKAHAQPMFTTWGAVFKHVILRGNIDYVMFNPNLASAVTNPDLERGREVQRVFDKVNANYYEQVDWALDIRDARFKDVDIRGIPARLILRDPATQVVVTRQKAGGANWSHDTTDGWKSIAYRGRTLDLSATHWPVAIEWMMDRGDPDIVLVAPRRHPKHRVLLDGLKRLRDAGIAEPD